MTEYAKILSFSNEIANALSQHDSLHFLYPHAPKSFREEAIKTLIDLVALISISVQVIDVYEKTKSRNKALATAAGNLLVAFMIPNLFMKDAIDITCPECDGGIKVIVASIFVYVLYKLEHPVVNFFERVLDKKIFSKIKKLNLSKVATTINKVIKEKI
tara:strand:- start:1436 stop:1912 length:477 start_codon:yes stop_codon:yes gene_type:complete